MFSKLQFGLMAGALALSVGAGVAYAALSGDEAITARKGCMKGRNGRYGSHVQRRKPL
jgi:hypothetical protein